MWQDAKVAKCLTDKMGKRDVDTLKEVFMSLISMPHHQLLRDMDLFLDNLPLPQMKEVLDCLVECLPGVQTRRACIFP